MKVIKIILGIILLLFSLLISIAVLSSSLNAVLETLVIMKKSTAEAIGYGLGSLFALVLVGFLVFLLIKFSVKLIKNEPPKKTTSEINEIGKSEV
jgi:large-conductance mechanosensitive channel